MTQVAVRGIEKQARDVGLVDSALTLLRCGTITPRDDLDGDPLDVFRAYTPRRRTDALRSRVTTQLA